MLDILSMAEVVMFSILNVCDILYFLLIGVSLVSKLRS